MEKPGEDHNFPSLSSFNPSLYGTVEETKIFLKSTKTIPLTVKTTDTLKSIKSRFGEIEVTSEQPQELILAGKRMGDDGRTLMEYHIRKNSTIDVILQQPTPIQIFIRMPSKQKHIMLQVKSTDTIHNVKVKIHGREGVPPDRQTLIYGGRTLENGQKSLSDYKVGDQATLVAVFRRRDQGMRLGIETGVGDHTVVVDVKGWYTVRDVKAIAESVVGISPEEGREIYYGKMLLEDDLTVMDCMIKKGSTLHLH